MDTIESFGGRESITRRHTSRWHDQSSDARSDRRVERTDPLVLRALFETGETVSRVRHQEALQEQTRVSSVRPDARGIGIAVLSASHFSALPRVSDRFEDRKMGGRKMQSHVAQSLRDWDSRSADSRLKKL